MRWRAVLADRGKCASAIRQPGLVRYNERLQAGIER
jgi:hypothetical protein